MCIYKNTIDEIQHYYYCLNILEFNKKRNAKKIMLLREHIDLLIDRAELMLIKSKEYTPEEANIILTKEKNKLERLIKIHNE